MTSTTTSAKQVCFVLDSMTARTYKLRHTFILVPVFGIQPIVLSTYCSSKGSEIRKYAYIPSEG